VAVMKGSLLRTIVQYHRVKMNAINEIIKEMWSNTYSGSDIDTIEIRSESAISNATGRRSYQYRVVMLKGDVEVDMKGRCSAGQKVCWWLNECLTMNYINLAGAGVAYNKTCAGRDVLHSLRHSCVGRAHCQLGQRKY
jgi:hypothetical protein